MMGGVKERELGLINRVGTNEDARERKRGLRRERERKRGGLRRERERERKRGGLRRRHPENKDRYGDGERKRERETDRQKDRESIRTSITSVNAGISLRGK